MEEKREDIKKFSPIRKLTGILLWIGGIWLALLIVLQIALSPAVLNRIINRYAEEYIDGNLSFSRAGLAMFRHFPNIGITIEDCSVTYPADRFDKAESEGAQGLLLTHGCGETADTLASFKRFSAGINVGALIAGKIRIPHIIIEKPRIFAHHYNEEEANWDIFRFTADEDTSETSLPPVSIGRIRLSEHPHIVYTDSRDTIFAMLDVKKITFDGRLDTRSTSRNRIGLALDSMMVAGRISADTLGVGLDKLHIHEHNGHFDVHAKAKAYIATRTFGRMRIPVSLAGNIAFPHDTVPALALHGIKADIAAIPISGDIDFKRIDGNIYTEAGLSVNGCKAEDVAKGFLKNIIPEAGNIKTDAAIFMTCSCRGYIGNGKMPDIDIYLSIPESKTSHKKLEHDIRLALEAAANSTEGRFDVTVSNADIATYGMRMKASGSISDILGDDPLIALDGRFKADADSLSTFFPQGSGMSASGSISADLKGSMLMSQADIYRFGQADLSGSVRSDSLAFRSPKDTIDIGIDSLVIKIAPEDKKGRSSSGNFRLMTLRGSIHDMILAYKDKFTLKGADVSLSAMHSLENLTDTSRIHPLGGNIKAAELSLKDETGMEIALDNTSNSLLMFPKKDHPEIPVLSISSTNKRIFVRDEAGRVILTDSKIKGKAAMNTVERRQRRKALMDSLARKYPDIPEDSLFSHLRSIRQEKALPDWLSEEDFRSKDINVRLDESIAGYFREWDVDANVNVRTGIVMTPYLPLRNILRGMDISITNDQVRIDSLKMISGKSEIAAKGSLSGLRRALLGRGTYDLDLSLSTGIMDADELIAAMNTGASFDPKSASESMSEATDAEFLQMVVADSLKKEDIQPLIVIPANLKADVHIDGKDIKFSGLEIERFNANILMKERCLQITNSSVHTNVGKGDFEAFYATRTKKDLKTGFNLNLEGITAEKVIDMMPAIDTIMPLLKSFKGLMNCEIAATASLDTCMNIQTPSINGVIRIGGKDLTMSDNKVFSDLAKKLKFKNNKEGKIDKMTVEGIIKDNTLEVFPFVIDVDRYTLAMSGLHNLDMSFKYHVSIIRSPMVFKVGVDLYGPDFDGMKFKIGKPKYKNTNVPVFTAVIDQTRINLAESIRNIFEKGVEAAVRENENNKAIEDYKNQTGYVNAAETQIEELSDEEQKQLEETSNTTDE